MAKIFNFYGKEVFDPGVYSKVLAVGNAAPTPSGENALVIIAEAINGLKFGELIAVSSVSEAKMLLGEQGPAIEAVFKALNASPTLSGAQDIRIFNPRPLVQASGTIKTTVAGDDAILVKSRIYGPIGNGVNVSLDAGVAEVEFPWSEDKYSMNIDNPIFTMTLTDGGMTIDGTKISVGPTASLVDYNFLDYPKLVDLLAAIQTANPTAVIAKDVNVSDNQSTIGLFDHISSEQSLTTAYTVKADLKQFFDFLNDTVADLEAELQATATVLPEDFDLTLSGGSSGTDPDATQWGLVYDELAMQKLAVTVPINDGLSAPYNEILTSAIMALDEGHAVNMSTPDKRGKKRQSFISAHGGYGWNGGYIAPPSDASAIVTLANTHNSEYSHFFGTGLNALNYAGAEYAQVPCYFAVQAASMFLGGLASRVLTSQQVTAIKATNTYKDADRKKLHKASVIIPVTDGSGTFIRQFYSTWKSTNEPMKTVPSRVRCAILSDNDLARKLESWMKGFQQRGISPYNAEGRTFIKRVLESHQSASINWVKSFGSITFTNSGIEFDYLVKDLVVPDIPEYGFGTVEVLNT